MRLIGAFATASAATVAKVLALSLTIGRVYVRLGASTWVTDADTVQWGIIWI